jgi:hypothetical protein
LTVEEPGLERVPRRVLAESVVLLAVAVHPRVLVVDEEQDPFHREKKGLEPRPCAGETFSRIWRIF